MDEYRSALWELEEINRQEAALYARRKEILARVRKDKDRAVDEARQGGAKNGDTCIDTGK